MNKDDISKKYNILPIVVDLLESRGIDSEEKLNIFLNPTDSLFYNPFLLKNMDKLVKRINKAMEKNEKVLIFGDYDVDGISASAILIKFFSSKNFYVDYYLPNRYIDGYGLTNEAIQHVKEKYNPNLIITVDCGISCYDEVEFAKSLGIEIVVTDHHDIPERIPDTIVVNPKIEKQEYPFKYLCGTGVAFKVVQALSGLDEAKKYLGICAIATIADIVPLVDENRAIVKLGMADFENNLPIGIKMIYNELKMPLTSSSTDIAYKLTPKLNAAGRMGDASIALLLYIKDDKILLKNTIDTLSKLNIERQALCNKIYDDAIEKINKINIAKYNVLCLYSKNWDSGVLGIVASRIANDYNRPTILLSEIDGILKGSARSINEIDIYSAISYQKNVLDTFGGHKMAVGLTIKKIHFNQFLNSLNEYLSEIYTANDYIEKIDYDLTPQLSEITTKLVEDLDLLEPCGCSNPKPVLKINLGDDVSLTTMPKHPNHIMIGTSNLNIIAFNSYKYLPLLKSTDKREVNIELQEDNYRKKMIKAISKSIACGKIVKVSNDDYLKGNYLKQLFYTASNKNFLVWDKDKLIKLIDEMKNSAFGYLFVCHSFETYKWFCKLTNQIELKHYLFEIISNSGINSVILSPNNFSNFSAYKKIIILDAVLSLDYLGKINENSSATIYLPKDKKVDKTIFDNLSCDRNVFKNYFKLLSNYSSKQSSFLNDINLFKRLYSLDKNINYKQFIFCLYVFIDLNIFYLEEELGMISLRENKKVVSTLTNSKFYNNVNLIIKSINR